MTMDNRTATTGGKREEQGRAGGRSADNRTKMTAQAYIAQQRAQFADGFSAIHTAHLRLQAALDVAIKERDDARAEVERLRAERDALRDAAREYLTTLGGAMKAGSFQMSGSAEMAHFVRQAMQRLDSLVFDRAGPRPAGLEKLHEPHGRAS